MVPGWHSLAFPAGIQVERRAAMLLITVQGDVLNRSEALQRELASQLTRLLTQGWESLRALQHLHNADNTT